MRFSDSTYPKPRPSFVATTLILALFLTACGSSAGTSSDAAEATADPTTEPTVAEEATKGQSSGSPIDDLLGIPIMDEGAMNDHFIDVISEGERLTAECMLNEGFQYTPETPSINGPSARENTDSREYVERVGYGLVAGFLDATVDATTQLAPNAAYLQTLTSGERQAYDAALYGEGTDETQESDGGASADQNSGFPTAAGCKALALDELASVFAVMDEFDGPAEDVFIQFDSDSRMLKSAEAWSECMAEAGYVASNRDEVTDLLSPIIEPILAQGDAIYVDDPDFNPELYEAGNDWSEYLSGNSFSPHPPLTAEATAQVDEVIAFEIELALADFDCYEPLRENERAILLEYEQMLVSNIGDAVSDRLDGN